MIDMHYINLIDDILDHVQRIQTRNSLVRRVFSRSLTFTSTPLVSVRKTSWRLALREWQWFLSGSNNINDLHESVRHWWSPWANDFGTIWCNYGQQFRHQSDGTYDGFDQIAYFLDGIKNHPYSRRNVIGTWLTADMADPCTPITNCHSSIVQAFVNPDNTLHLKTYQRSADVIVGLPCNWIQSWAFLLWLCHRTGRVPGSLIWDGGDLHVYDEHDALAREIVAAAPRTGWSPPLLTYTPTSEEFLAEDFALDGEYRLVDRDEGEDGGVMQWLEWRGCDCS